MQFYCSCLNVTITVLDCFDDSETLNKFFRSDFNQLLDVPVEWAVSRTLSNQPVEVKWSSLKEKISIRDLTIHRCSICHEYTHVTSHESTEILINKNLLNEQNVNKALHDENYSSMAKIILPKTVNPTDFVFSANDQDDSSRREQEIIQQAYRQALDDAERETEEKIRSFQREQEQILEKQTKILNRQLETFLTLIRSTNRHSTTNKISPPLHNSSSFIHENSMESGFGSDIFDISTNDWSRQSLNFERNQFERNVDPDDELSLENFDWSINSTNPLIYGSSLPKTIALRPMAIAQNDDEKNDLERIGKSFHQLSQSLMCKDGTELFGDLPSPRFNLRAT